MRMVQFSNSELLHVSPSLKIMMRRSSEEDGKIIHLYQN